MMDNFLTRAVALATSWNQMLASSGAPEPQWQDGAPGSVSASPSSSFDAVPVPRPRPDGAREAAGPMWLLPVNGAPMPITVAGATVFGRAPSSDVVIADESVSGLHCTIEPRGDRCVVTSHTDMMTSVNGLVVEMGHQKAISPGDHLKVGSNNGYVLRRQLESPRTGRLRLHSAAGSRTGQRQGNQDRYEVTSNALILADGVGGRPGGDKAATIAVRVVQGLVTDQSPIAQLSQWPSSISRQLADSRRTSPLLSTMATTIDVAILNQSSGNWLMSGAHVGDADVFVVDNQDWLQLTRRDTARESIMASGQVPDERISDLSALTRFVSADDQPAAQVWSWPARVGQRWVMCSDGVVDGLGRELRQIVLETRSIRPQFVVTLLIDELLRSGNEIDNITVLIADVIEAANPISNAKTGGVEVNPRQLTR